MKVLRVKQPGPRTTVEDLGRRHVARFGVPPGGAFDSVALRAANRLVGNPDDAAGLELTLLGPVLENTGDEPMTAVLVGAPAEGTLVDGGQATQVPPDRPFLLPPGSRIRLSDPLRVARAWLAVAGGIEVPWVLGSRSTYVPGGFGGLDGRPLRAGDELAVGSAGPGSPDARWRDPMATSAPEVPLGILAGPQEDAFSPRTLERLCAISWQIQPTSDRTGVRLSPGGEVEPLAAPPGIPPEGTTLGAVQLPPDGCPILLGPDRPITGGYAKPALVVRAHLGRVARLRPGDRVRFERLRLEEAVELEGLREASLPVVPGG